MKQFPFSLPKLASALLVGAIVIVATAGCDDNSKPDLSDAKDRVKKVETFNQIYKSANGDWNSVTPDQKEQLIKMQGSEVSAQAAFIGAKEGPFAAQKFIQEARASGKLK